MALFGKKTNDSDVKTDDKSAKVKNEVKKSMKDLYEGDTKLSVKADKKADPKSESKKERCAYRVLVKPLITEKAANMGAEDKYVFEVNVDSNKIEVTNAIEEVYGIRPVSVNMIKMEGKKKRQGRKIGKRKDWKKAMVTLPKGKTIDIYEGV